MNERFERRSRFGHNDRQQFAPPVRVDEELDVKIEAVGEKGDGVAKKDGFVLFVPNVKEGDYVRVKVTKVLRKVGFAEVVGAAQAPEPTQEKTPETIHQEPKEKEEEFQPSEDDSEDFGEESTDDEVEEETEDADDEQKQEAEEADDEVEETKEESEEEAKEEVEQADDEVEAESEEKNDEELEDDETGKKESE